MSLCANFLLLYKDTLRKWNMYVVAWYWPQALSRASSRCLRIDSSSSRTCQPCQLCKHCVQLDVYEIWYVLYRKRHTQDTQAMSCIVFRGRQNLLWSFVTILLSDRAGTTNNKQHRGKWVSISNWPLILIWCNFNPTIMKCRMKLLIQSQTSSVPPFKFGNREVISRTHRVW